MVGGPQLCALGKVSVLGAVSNSQALRETGSGGAGPVPSLPRLKVSPFSDLPGGTFDISLTYISH